MALGVAREGKWRGNWRMELVASTLHTTLECDLSSITTAHAHNSAFSSRLNWRPSRFKWIRPFRRKTKSGFCACAVTFQKQSTTFMLSKAGDNEAEKLKGWLFLDYCLFIYLCQGSLLKSVTTSTWSGESRKTTWLLLPFIIASRHRAAILSNIIINEIQECYCK